MTLWRARAVTTLLVIVSITAAACTSTPSADPTAPTSPVGSSAGQTANPPVSLPAAPSSPATKLIERPPTQAPTVEDQVPPVVSLAWLDGRVDQAGVFADHDVLRWYGNVPGETAILADEAYQWFGPDGSVVGCSQPRRCLGIDAAGNLATVQSNGDRLVYSPTGDPIDRFAPDGRPLGGDMPSFADQLATTGVNLGTLLDAATRTEPFAGGVSGDPHLVTAAGRRYSTQRTGEFHARTGDPLRQVQLRFEPMPHQPDVSLVTGVAVGVGESVVEFQADGTVLVDDKAIEAPAPSRSVSLPDGTQIAAWAADRAIGRAAIIWPDGSNLVAVGNKNLGLTVVLHAPQIAGVSGLFGVGGSDPTNDLKDRSGQSVDADGAADSWLVLPDESLFAEPVEPTPGFPATAVSPPQAATSFADSVCRQAGIVDVDDLAACGFDVALTGDEGFAIGHSELAASVSGQVAPSITAQWPAMAAPANTAAELADTAGELADRADVNLGAGDVRHFRVPAPGGGEVRVEFASGCASPGESPTRDQAAVRLFDDLGRAVSDRLPTCGQQTIATVEPGTYFLVVAGPATGDAVQVRLTVQVS